MRWHRVVLPLAGVVALSLSCVTPSDHSSDFRVIVEAIPNLFPGDTVQAVARVIDAGGGEVHGVAIVFGTSDQTVASVSPAGKVVATGTGTVGVLAWAPGLENAGLGRTEAAVHGAVEIDSVLPGRVRYGSQLLLYGVGLDPAGAAVVTTGVVTAPIKSYTPADPAHPERYGVLRIVVVPPLGQNSDEVTPIEVPITVTTTRGVATLTASMVIEPRDIYEPNDSVAADLGVISGRFEALGLAFDRLDPSTPSLPVDWYTFTTANRGDWTITLRSADAWRTYATADLINGPLAYTGGTLFGSSVALWYIDRPTLPTSGMTGACGGFASAILPLSDPQDPQFTVYGPFLPFGPSWDVNWPQVRWVLEGLPAGSHHLLVGFAGGLYGEPLAPGTSLLEGILRSALTGFIYPIAGDPIRYDLIIEPGLHTDLPPDRFESNDFCEGAPTLLSLGPAAFADSIVDNLTIDAEFDWDWFVVDAQTPGRLYLTVESDHQGHNASPLLLSPSPGVGQPVTLMHTESRGQFFEEQQFRSRRDGAPGIPLEARSYYVAIQPGNPRSYRLRLTWVPVAAAVTTP